MSINLDIKHKIFSEAFPPNERGERQQLLSLSSFHDLIKDVIINPDNIIYKPLTKDNLIEIQNLHKEWFPIDYNEEYFQKVLDNQNNKYFTVGAFYNLKNPIDNENNEIILGLALCKWKSISIDFIDHMKFEAIKIIFRNINFQQSIESFLSCKMFHCLYIMTIGVIDEYRHMNIGTNLLNYIYNIALRDHICVGIFLDVVHYNKIAIKFYEKNQFKKVNQIKDYYEINNKNYDCDVYFRVITKKERENFQSQKWIQLTEFINKYIVSSINCLFKSLVFILCFKCLRKKEV